MAKVVINSCYGGFGLSEQAKDRMVELGFNLKPNPYFNPREKISNFNSKYVWSDIDRNDPTLIKVVEELGSEKASGDCSRLEIVEVDGLFIINEKDGLESIETPEKGDWEMAY
jgi:hypothetical protein